MARAKGSVEIVGYNKLMAVFENELREAKADEKAEIAVGYSASYSFYVHENLAIVHTNGQAKFLEQPLREMGKELADFLTDRLKRGDRLSKALFYTADKLLRASKKLVPVRTGLLKASGYAKVVKGREVGQSIIGGEEG